MVEVEGSGFSHAPLDDRKDRQGRYEPRRVSTVRELIPSGQGKRALDIGCGSLRRRPHGRKQLKA